MNILELEGGGTARLAATVHFDEARLALYVSKSEYWSVYQELRRFPLAAPNWNETYVEFQPSVSPRLRADVEISTELSTADVLALARVYASHVEDVEIMESPRTAAGPLGGRPDRAALGPEEGTAEAPCAWLVGDYKRPDSRQAHQQGTSAQVMHWSPSFP